MPGAPASVQQQDDCDFTGMPIGLPRGAGVQQAAASVTPEIIAAGAGQASANTSKSLQNRPPKALQGNIDPHVLFAPPEAIRAEARRVLDRFGAPHRDPAARGVTHIFNLGHGISQFTPPEHVAALVEAVHSHSRAQRQR